MVQHVVTGGWGRLWALAAAIAVTGETGTAAAGVREDEATRRQPAEDGGIGGDAPQWDWQAAQEQARSRGRRHDGFMLRMTVGPGYFWREHPPGGATTISPRRAAELPLEGYGDGDGSGTSLGLDLGYGLDDELTLHARYALTLASAAPSFADATGGGAQWLTTQTLGPALTYHLMPLNAYGTVSGGVAFGELSIAETSAELRVGIGYGFSLDLGKEWWVDREWGLGVALRWIFVNVPTEFVPDDGAIPTESTLRTWGAALLFSATYQ
jgi:hypothetical protein